MCLTAHQYLACESVTVYIACAGFIIININFKQQKIALVYHFAVGLFCILKLLHLCNNICL